MFEPFPKIPRISKHCVVSEKIDGTNAQIVIEDTTGPAVPSIEEPIASVGQYIFAAGSRNRFVYPGKDRDNYGFAAWVVQNAPELVKLGVGRHFGEWYGLGINRSYDLHERRFALFNAGRWIDDPELPKCCEVVPVLYEGPFSEFAYEQALAELQLFGSQAAPGFMNPEGVVIYHTAARQLFKKTFDDNHKEAA